MDEKVVVKTDFLNSTHGKQSCSSCHGGVETSEEKEVAHKGLVRDPSEGEATACSSCHAATVKSGVQSLHSGLGGFKTVLADRGGHLSGALEEGFSTHCAGCHGSCGQCHVSRPTTVGGGLLSGHQFKKTPPMKETCTSCHVTRVGQEYLGENPGLDGDVHWTKAAMLCTGCHKTELHAASAQGETRYTKDEVPQCTDCHAQVASGGSGNQQHDVHGSNLSCQVCHSIPYKNCEACHVGKDAAGVKYFKTDATILDFKIGLNPIQSPERPAKYVTVRHAPASPGAFDYYAPGLQPQFDAVPTWKYATPHNIQRRTPQNASCDACHGNASLFLTSKDVKPNEADANRPVIVTSVPKAR